MEFLIKLYVACAWLTKKNTGLQKDAYIVISFIFFSFGVFFHPLRQGVKEYQSSSNDKRNPAERHLDSGADNSREIGREEVEGVLEIEKHIVVKATEAREERGEDPGLFLGGGWVPTQFLNFTLYAAEQRLQ